MKKTTQNTVPAINNRLESVGNQFRHKSNIMRCELIMDAARKKCRHHERPARGEYSHRSALR